MTRAELVAEVRRLADQTAGLAADVRRRDTALELLGQVRDFGHRLPPGLAADIRAVVDDMVAARRHEAQAGPHSPAAGTSSTGGSGQRPPAAPSTETRQAAQDGQSGSGGDAMDGVPAHQPTPQIGDVWRQPDRMVEGGAYRLTEWSDRMGMWVGHDGRDEFAVTIQPGAVLLERDGQPWPPAQEPERPRKGEVWEKGGMRVRLHRKAGSPTNTRGDWLWVATIVELMPELDGPWAVGETITVELDRGGWFRDSPAQEPEPVAVEPATDEQIAAWSKRVLPTGSAHAAIDALVARVRQEQGQATEFLNGRTRWQGRAQIAEGQVQRLIGERDEAVDRTYAAVDRANAAEAALAGAERVTDLERAVVQAAQAHTTANVVTTWRLLRDAVRALHEAEAVDQ